MENFTAYNPTSLHFGKNICSNLTDILKIYGKKVFLIYGKGSITKNGIYQDISKKLADAKFEVIEFSGIKPNPILEDIENAIDTAYRENPDIILAIGGGSVIDSAKIISVCINGKLDPWKVVKGKEKPLSAIPVITVLTLAATGTEMNHFAVIQNQKTKEKIGYRNNLMYPKHSFLDPEFTYTVSDNQTAYGISDIIAHSLENYFGYGVSGIADRFSIQIISECLRYAPLVLKEPNNYEYRANIMMLSTCALNGITAYGKTGGDWGVHAIGHTLSMLFDTPHGASLSIAYPAWLKLMKNLIPEKIQTLSTYLFNNDNIDEFINHLIQFYLSIGAPVTLQDIGIELKHREQIFNLMSRNKVSGYVYPLSENDYNQILDYMYGK